jgi:hypothetical protein
LPEFLRKLQEVQDTTIEPLFGVDFPFNIGDLRLVIFALILILTMLLRPQGIFGTNEFGLSWLKRPRKKDEGTNAVGADAGVPEAQQREAKRLESEDED